jgi:hypothetical protein
VIKEVRTLHVEWFHGGEQEDSMKRILISELMSPRYCSRGKSFSSQSVQSRPTDTVDLTRSSTNSLDSDDEAMAGAFDPNPDPAANLGVFLSIDSCKYLIRQRCRGSQEDLAVTYL